MIFERAIGDAGFEHPSEVQQNAIPFAMVGQDMIVQAKSGMGVNFQLKYQENVLRKLQFSLLQLCNRLKSMLKTQSSILWFFAMHVNLLTKFIGNSNVSATTFRTSK